MPMSSAVKPAAAAAVRVCATALVAGVWSTTCLALVAPPGAFVAAGGGIYNAHGDALEPDMALQSSTTPQAGSFGSLPAAWGSVRANFGSLGFDMLAAGGVDREVDGGALWADGWTVTGGSGAGVLSISTSIHGSIAGQAEAVLALYASSQPFEFTTVVEAITAAHGFWKITIPNATRVQLGGVVTGCGTPGASRECGHGPVENVTGPFSTTVVSNIPFVYGQPVYVLSMFAGGASANGGQASFLHSADLGLSAPAGATVSALSGTVYPAAVPEPAAWLLLLLGGAALAPVRRAAVRRLRASHTGG